MKNQILPALLAFAVAFLPRAAGAQDAPIPLELRRLLASPYAAERERGIVELGRHLERSGADPAALLRDPDPVVRVGVIRGLARSATDLAGQRKLLAALRDLDEDARREAATAVFAAAERLWKGEAPLLGPEAVRDPLLRGVVRDQVLDRLAALVAAGTPLTDHRALASFAVLGRLGEEVLAELVRDEDLHGGVRILAIGALSRSDDAGLFCTAEGAPSAGLAALLADPEDSVKLAALYGLAFRGPDSPALLAELARWVREDAFNELTIEAALYALHTSGRQALAAIPGAVDRLLDEFLDTLYSQRVRFHAAQLLMVVGPRGHEEQALAMIEADPGPSSYWMLAALLNGLDRLPEENRARVEERALTLALRAAGPPQLRALAIWFLRERGRALPAGLDPEKVKTDVRAAIAAVGADDGDPDFYAIRSGLEILAFLRDAEAAALIREHLGHESEAVRMVAALAAGQGGFRELREEVAKLLREPEEYAAFGAASGLDMLGDPRGLAFLADYLATGNACLMPAALERLRTSTGKVLAPGVPDRPSAWRVRAALWRAELGR